MSMYGFLADFFTVLQVLVGVFLIFIIMLQRGKGGGLVGALGGMGGASAFGPKADIQVLKLTIGLAVAWVFFACVGIFFNRWYTDEGTLRRTASPGALADPNKKAEETKAGAADKGATDKAATDKDGPKLEVTPGADKAKATPEKSEGAEKKPADTKSEPAAEAKPEEKSAPAKAEAPAEKPAPEEKK